MSIRSRFSRSTVMVASASAFLAVGLLACHDAAPSTSPAAAESDATGSSEPAPTTVKNVDAQPGDTTTCPFSGRAFVVKAEHPQVEYEGKTYWVCSDEAAERVRAEPSKYLDGFEG